MGKIVDKIPPHVMDQLTSYEWLGNVRELRNVLERAIITSQDKILNFPERIGSDATRSTEVDPSNGFSTLEAIERRHIMRVLEATGLLTIGMPGSDQGIGDDMVTLATLLKPHGYTSGQFGKNYLGDQNKHLPTVHGFDEFFGNLYHLNAEEEPEGYYYPKDAEFRKQFGPRGVIHSWADGKGGQKIKDTGPTTSSPTRPSTSSTGRGTSTPSATTTGNSTSPFSRGTSPPPFAFSRRGRRSST